MGLQEYLKGPFGDPQPYSPHFPPKKLRYLQPLGTKCMCAKYFLEIHLFEDIIAELAVYYVDMKNKQHIGLNKMQCNKTCIILKRNLQIDWKCGHKLILSIDTY